MRSSVCSTAVNILAPKFVLVVEIVTKRYSRLIFWDTRQTSARCSRRCVAARCRRRQHQLQWLWQDSRYNHLETAFYLPLSLFYVYTAAAASSYCIRHRDTDKTPTIKYPATKPLFLSSMHVTRSVQHKVTLCFFCLILYSTLIFETSPVRRAAPLKLRPLCKLNYYYYYYYYY